MDFNILKRIHKRLGMDYEFIKGEIVSFEDEKLTIDVGDKMVEMIPDEDIVYLPSKEISGKVNIYYVNELEIFNSVVAIAVCNDEYLQIFSKVGSTGEMIELMKTYDTMDPAIKNTLNKIYRNEECDQSEVDELNCLTSLSEMIIKYCFCKNNYSDVQKKTINSLIHGASENDKKRERLAFILSLLPVKAKQTDIPVNDAISSLDRKVYGNKFAKKTIMTEIAYGQLLKKGSIILLIGGEGTGKSLLAQSVAQIRNRPVETIYLSAISSTLEIIGVKSDYQDASLGKLAEAYKLYGNTDITLILEHVDEICNHSGKEGNVSDSLSVLLNGQLDDKFAGYPIDTSKTFIIMTARSKRDLPKTILERSIIIELSDQTDNDRLQIGLNFLLPKLLQESGCINNEIRINAETMRYVISNYCCDAGSSDLDKNLQMIIKNAFIKIHEDCLSYIQVDNNFVKNCLEQEANKSDVKFQFQRKKGSLSNEVRSEIKSLLEEAENIRDDIDRKNVCYQKADYLLTLNGENTRTEKFDSYSFYSVFNDNLYGLKGVKDDIYSEFNARYFQEKSITSFRLLLYGPAGVGKTSIAQSIAKSLHREFAKIPLNGKEDPRTIKGSIAFPGELIKKLYKIRRKDAVILLDEIDKCSESVIDCLCDLLDGVSEFTDDFLQVPIDISNAVFIATANDISSLPPWLIDRFHIVHINGYTSVEKMHILLDYILSNKNKAFKGSGYSFEVHESAADILINKYSYSPGIRELERTLGKIIKDKMAHKRTPDHLVITADDVFHSLGPEPAERGNLIKDNVPGHAVGLGIMGNIGYAFSIETKILPNEEKIITGLAERVIEECSVIAHSYIRSCSFATNNKSFGYHLHLGEASIKKDGPSAGVAILISMLSAYIDQAPEGNAAYTGEIDLNGYVFAVGMIKEKIRAAEKNGFSRVYIPADNFRRLNDEDLNEFTIEIRPVSNVKEVINEVFPQLINS